MLRCVGEATRCDIKVRLCRTETWGTMADGGKDTSECREVYGGDIDARNGKLRLIYTSLVRTFLSLLENTKYLMYQSDVYSHGMWLSRIRA